MQTLRALAILGALFCLAPGLPADAGGQGASAPLRVSQPFDVPDAALPGLRPGQVVVQDITLGSRSVSIRIAHDEEGCSRLVDVSAIEAALGARFERRGREIVLDRPDSGERARLDLVDGTLRVDGVRQGTVEIDARQAGSRLWLSADAVRALTGRPVTLGGPAPELPVMAQKGPAKQGGEARLVLASAAPPDGASYQPAAWPADTSPAADIRPLAGLSARTAPASSYAGVFGEQLSRTAGENAGREDWRTAPSWQIEPDRENRPVAPQPSGPQTTQVNQAAGDTQVAVTPRSEVPAKASVPSPETPHVQPVGPSTPRLQAVSAVHDPAAPARIDAALKPADMTDSAPASVSPGSPDFDLETALEPRGKAASRPVSRRGSGALYDRPAAQPMTSRLDGKRGDEYTVAGVDKAGSGADRVQLQGTVFLDMDGDGQAGPGDQRLEGERLQLIGGAQEHIQERRTAAFGQFGFTGLRPGTYKLRVMLGWQEHVMEVTLMPGGSAREVALAIPFELPEQEQQAALVRTYGAMTGADPPRRYE